MQSYARLLEKQVYQSCRTRCWGIQAPSQREDNTPAQTMSHVTGRRAVANWQSSFKYGVEIRLFLQNGKFKANCADPRPPGLVLAAVALDGPMGGLGRACGAKAEAPSKKYDLSPRSCSLAISKCHHVNGAHLTTHKWPWCCRLHQGCCHSFWSSRCFETKIFAVSKERESSLSLSRLV
jgi:hypothetical protein